LLRDSRDGDPLRNPPTGWINPEVVPRQPESVDKEAPETTLPGALALRFMANETWRSPYRATFGYRLVEGRVKRPLADS
jgi:hypothetical protein